MDITRELLASFNGDYDDFYAWSMKIDRSDQNQLFENLFEWSIECPSLGVSALASCMLVEIEPKCNKNCSELLDFIADSKWDVSNRLIPFYLITQFGKYNVINEVEKYLSKRVDLNETQRNRVGTVTYWANRTMSDLIKSYHEWEWDDIINSKHA